MTPFYRVIPFMVYGVCASAHAQDAPNRNNPLTVKHTVDFEVTGDGVSTEWKAAEWIDLSRIKGALSYTSKVKLLYSDKGIYALYNFEDKKIFSTLREDFVSLWKEDVAEMFIWPDDSVPIYFEYQISPYNYELAILVPNLNGRSSGWTPWNYKGEKKTRHAAKIRYDDNNNPTGWSAEVFIPYRLLSPLGNIPPKKGTQWRMNLYRIDYDNNDESYWTWQPIDKSFHEFKKYGVVVFE
jgi:hypothetical protein